MLKIGEVVKQFNLTHRTLRYWEEEKILHSKGTDNLLSYSKEKEEFISNIIQNIIAYK